MASVVKNTSDRLWDTLSSARNTGKWYNKLYQVPISPFAGAAEVIEGAVRTVLEPSRNLVLNTRDTVANLFTNFGRSIRWLFRTDVPVSDFSFDKLEYKKPTWDNRMSKLAFWKRSTPANTANKATDAANKATDATNKATDAANKATDAANTQNNNTNTQNNNRKSK